MNEPASLGAPRLETSPAHRLARALPWLECAALMALAFVLPLREAPKNILLLLWAALWLANALRRTAGARWGGPWDAWDTVIALWLGSGYAAALFAGIRHDEWTLDLLLNLAALWMVKRGGYDNRTLLRVIVALAAGTLAGLLEGYYGILFSQERMVLGLKSVGHVNHSAIYLAIVFGASLMAARAWWHVLSSAWRVAASVVLALFTASLFVMQSRAAVAAAALAAAVLLLAYGLRRRQSLKPLALAALAAAALMVAVSPQVVEKNQEFMQRGALLNSRDAIWRTALAAWREFPVFGVGMDNFGQVSEARIAGWKAARGEPFERNEYFYSSHAHSVYFNTLAERGALGLAALLVALIGWGWSLARHVPGRRAGPLAWTYWGGAASAWLVSASVGLVNTTLHHEHALLSMLLLGGWLALRPRA